MVTEFRRLSGPSSVMPMLPMFSRDWFETFAATVPAALMEKELRGIMGILPLAHHGRILDVGSGIGRIAGPLSSHGYSVTGFDVSVEALRLAQRSARGPRYVALDSRHVSYMGWSFDAALLLWHSLGFVGRNRDLETLTALRGVVRPGGKILLDVFHPDWLERHERTGEPDPRGAVSVRRWVSEGRCFHDIRYANGTVDDIQFDVYQPDELRALAERAGLTPGQPMVWWDTDSRPNPDCARYQVVCTRPDLPD